MVFVSQQQHNLWRNVSPLRNKNVIVYIFGYALFASIKRAFINGGRTLSSHNIMRYNSRCISKNRKIFSSEGFVYRISTHTVV